MEHKVEIDPAVFNDAYIPCLNEMARIQIYYGGASSGKSVFLAQRDVRDVMKGGRNFLVCRQVARTLRGSVVQEITKIIRDWGLSDLFSINKTDGTVTCVNGYQIIFAGLDDVEKLKSLTPAKGVFTDVRVEEATEIERSSIIKQLLKRQRGGSEKTPKRLMLSFNPILQSHFIYADYFSMIGWTNDQKEYKSPDLYILKTTYRDNRFLTREDVRGLENEKDKYYFDVYSEGNWGILGHVIFTNWRVEDLSGMQAQFTNHRNGLDFGFSADPAALWVSHYDAKHKRIYVFDELYERGLTNDLLAVEVKNRIGGDYVVCDSAEPKSIAELQQYGVSALAAVKGKDSVLFGIQWLQQQEIIIDAKCVNAKNEISTFHWQEDANGNAIRKPVEKNDHLIAAGRYAHEGDMIETWLVS
ncbi:MAG TPA: PBSX family phage terminase large subunit [Anaerolineales bacterium]|nr:PBSX family phage terminase large subunit [Anaerolineales bacterium]